MTYPFFLFICRCCCYIVVIKFFPIFPAFELRVLIHIFIRHHISRVFFFICCCWVLLCAYCREFSGNHAHWFKNNFISFFRRSEDHKMPLVRPKLYTMHTLSWSTNHKKKTATNWKCWFSFSLDVGRAFCVINKNANGWNSAGAVVRRSLFVLFFYNLNFH